MAKKKAVRGKEPAGKPKGKTAGGASKDPLAAPIREVPSRTRAKKDAVAKKAEREESAYFDILPDTFYTLPSDKQKFIIEYLRTGNGSASVTFANSMTGQKARAQAMTWTNNPVIRGILTAVKNEIYRREAMDILETRVRIARHARAKLTDVAFWDDNSLKLIPSAELDEATASSIREISRDADGNVKIKMHDSQKALENMAKMHGLFKDDDTASEGLLLSVIRKLAADEQQGKKVDAEFTEGEE